MLWREALRGLAPHECTGSLTKAVSHGVVRRRFCARCAREDTRQYGEIYWHHSHLSPGVYVCPKHGQPLATTTEFVRRIVELREVQMPNGLASSVAPPQIPHPVLVSIASTSIAALTRRTLAPWRERFRAAALHSGYRLPSGDFACRTLAHNLYDLYGKDFLKESGCLFDPSARSPWPALLVGPECEGVAATPKYIFMDVFLRSTEPIDVLVRAEYRRLGPLARDYAKLDTRTASRIVTFLSVSSRDRKRYSVRRLLELTKSWSLFRHNRRNFPLTQRIIAKFKMTNQAARQVGRRPHWRRLRSRP